MDKKEAVLSKCICGNTKPKLKFELNVDPPNKVRSKAWQVICMTCGISGPNRGNGPMAIKDWNNLVDKSKEKENG